MTIAEKKLSLFVRCSFGSHRRPLGLLVVKILSDGGD